MLSPTDILSPLGHCAHPTPGVSLKTQEPVPVLRLKHYATDPLRLRTNQKSSMSTKLKVILDLDETLVHARIAAGNAGISQIGNVAGSSSDADARKVSADSIEIRLRTENEELVTINRRPGLESFLEASSKQFHLYAFVSIIFISSFC